MTRRHLQVCLGWLWLLDGALQLQPFMFGPGFAKQVVLPAAEGQPAVVADGVEWAAALISSHPVVWGSLFAAVQLAIGLGLLLRSTVRPALVVSVGWALGVWYFGEGLGGLASGHADLLTGAPGAVLLYAVLAAAAWPSSPARGRPEPAEEAALRQAEQPPASWLPVAWAVLWVGAALLRALPGQNTPAALAGDVLSAADGAPDWLAALDHKIAAALHGAGGTSVVVIVLVEAAIGVGGLVAGPVRRVAALAGIVVTIVFWVVGQSLGELYSGSATDPNTGPLVVVLALALLSIPSSAPAAGEQQAPSLNTELGPGEEAAPG